MVRRLEFDGASMPQLRDELVALDHSHNCRIYLEIPGHRVTPAQSSYSSDFSFWDQADLRRCPNGVRSRGQIGCPHRESRLPKMTQIGHLQVIGRRNSRLAGAQCGTPLAPIRTLLPLERSGRQAR